MVTAQRKKKRSGAEHQKKSSMSSKRKEPIFGMTEKTLSTPALHATAAKINKVKKTHKANFASFRKRVCNEGSGCVNAFFFTAGTLAKKCKLLLGSK